MAARVGRRVVIRWASKQVGEIVDYDYEEFDVSLTLARQQSQFCTHMRAATYLTGRVASRGTP